MNVLKFPVCAIVVNFMIFSLAFVFSLQVARADLTVGDLVKDVIHTADRGITPTDDLNIFDGESGSYVTGNVLFGRYMKWRCLSSSSPVSGACETGPTSSIVIPSVVQLEFTELRSNVKATVNFHGSKQLYSSFNGLYCGPKVRMNWGNTFGCGAGPDAAKLFLFIPRTEIAKLPFGGIWQATLKLRTGGYQEAYHGTWTANITLHVSDNNNISIYFPQFNQPSTDARKRVDYRASLRYNGRDVALPNNEVVTLGGINQAEFRPVLLPNIPQPVYCTPTPLSLTTPAFNQISKENGNYSGSLRVIFTPSLE